jgi:hypothetical protein
MVGDEEKGKGDNELFCIALLPVVPVSNVLH